LTTRRGHASTTSRKGSIISSYDKGMMDLNKQLLDKEDKCEPTDDAKSNVVLSMSSLVSLFRKVGGLAINLSLV
jgi:hypothetical protein